jgi:hypothetical protein
VDHRAALEPEVTERSVLLRAILWLRLSVRDSPSYNENSCHPKKPVRVFHGGHSTARF